MVRSDDFDIAQLGLTDFLEAAGGPACIVRVARKPTSSTDETLNHGEHGHDDGVVSVIWQNRLLQDDETQDSAVRAIEKARDDIVTSTTSSFVACDVSVQVGHGGRIRWRCVPLQAGAYWALTGKEEDDSGLSGPSESRPSAMSANMSSTSSIPTIDPRSKVPSYEPEVADVFVEDGPDRLDWISVTGRTPESRAFIELFKGMDWEHGKLGHPSGWSTSLVTMVNVCLSSPFPVLLSWGSDKVLL